MIRRLCGVVLALAATACAAPYVPPKEPTQAEWEDALRKLAALRASFPKKPYTQPITVDFHEPYTRRRFEGRGAVGVDPGHAMRMILVGPGGGTALDAWVTRDAWRMAVPAISFQRRGGRDAPTSTPVGFFRAWFIDPLGGRLLALGRGGSFILRDDAGGTSDISIDAHEPGVFAGRGARRSGKATERFEWVTRARGGEAHYRHLESGLGVDVELGPPQSEAPDPQAFVDPDEAHGASR